MCFSNLSLNFSHDFYFPQLNYFKWPARSRYLKMQLIGLILKPRALVVGKFVLFDYSEEFGPLVSDKMA